MSEHDFEKPKIQFVQTAEDEEAFHHKDLIELTPLGLSLAQNMQKPFLLLRDNGGKLTLPVAISPLEAGFYLASTQKGHLQTTPHRFLENILSSLDIRLRQCVFVQILPDVQMVRVYFTGHPSLSSMKLRIDEALSVCVHFQVPLFATKKFIQKSLLIQVEPDLKDHMNRLGDERPLLLPQINQRFLM